MSRQYAPYSTTRDSYSGNGYQSAALTDPEADQRRVSNAATGERLARPVAAPVLIACRVRRIRPLRHL